ncbi:hypothetical protein B5P43_15665 [Bacillus sp. SRB_336]|nr:hypothetical protein B5P43_15665 [Bacillus sp. SRB_336]
MAEGYSPPAGEYVRPARVYRIEDPRNDESFDTHYVRGGRFHERAFKGTKDGQEVDFELVPEPGNPHDKWAVALHLNGSRIGYIGAEYAAEWQDVVVALNESGYAVMAYGVIESVNEFYARAYLPWVSWSEPTGPPFTDECCAILDAWASEQRGDPEGGEVDPLPSLRSPGDIGQLQELATFAPSLNWQSQTPSGGLPMQLIWHLQAAYAVRRREKLAAQEALRATQQAEAYRLRVEKKLTFAAIATDLGCSPSLASKRYSEYLDAIPDVEKAAQDADRLAAEADLRMMVLEEHARGIRVGLIAEMVGCAPSAVRRILRAAGVDPLVGYNTAARDERLARCREACRMQEAGRTRRDIAASLGTSLDGVKTLLKDGKFFEDPSFDFERLVLARNSRSPELSGLGLEAAATVLGVTVAKLKAARRDHAVLRGLHGEALVADEP